jgi:hypothetical protein
MRSTEEEEEEDDGRSTASSRDRSECFAEGSDVPSDWLQVFSMRFTDIGHELLPIGHEHLDHDGLIAALVFIYSAIQQHVLNKPGMCFVALQSIAHGTLARVAFFLLLLYSQQKKEPPPRPLCCRTCWEDTRGLAPVLDKRSRPSDDDDGDDQMMGSLSAFLSIRIRTRPGKVVGGNERRLNVPRQR